MNETGPLLSLGGLSLFLWIFVKVAGAMREGDTEAIDRALLLGLRVRGSRSDPVGPEWFEEAARDITALGGPTLLTLLAVGSLAALLLLRQKRAALFVSLALVGGWVLSDLLKLGFHRTRPDVVPHIVEVYSASFPSGHAMLSAVTYLTLGALLARVQKRKRMKAFLLATAVFLTVIVGLSRIYLGVHWPTDVLAGWAVGAAWAALCWFVELQLQRRGTVEGDRPLVR